MTERTSAKIHPPTPSSVPESVNFPQRLGHPEELASMVLECVTNSYMNGETVRVDGAVRMPPT